MFDGSLRTAGAASTSMDEEDIKLFGRTMERVRHASRGIYQQTRRSASEQVRKIEKKRKRDLNSLTIFTMCVSYCKTNGYMHMHVKVMSHNNRVTYKLMLKHIMV